MPKSKYKKRADGRYSAQIYLGKKEDGTRKVKTIYGNTPTELETKLTDARIQLKKGIDISNRDTFGKWVGHWLAVKKGECTASQYRLYEVRSGYFTEAFGHYPLASVTTMDVQEVINQLAQQNPHTKKPSAKKTLNGIKQIAFQIFSFAVENRTIDYNPAQYVRIPKNAPKTERRALTKTERTWIEETPHRAQTAAMIMLYAGLRRGELTALTWRDVDLQSKTITVNKSVNFKEKAEDGGAVIKTPKSAAGNRVINIPQKLADYLSGIERNSIYIVTGASGQIMSVTLWRRLWESYMIDLDVKYGKRTPKPNSKAKPGEPISKFDPTKGEMLINTFTPHCLRHTYCTILYEAGVDVLVAMALMGHSDVKTTLGIYTHLEKEHKEKDIGKLDKYLSGSTEEQVESGSREA